MGKDVCMNPLLLISCFLGFLGVAGGAFGAHALKARLSPDMLTVFEVGIRYQMYHLFAIFAAVWLNAPLAGWLFFSGIILFSGSLYLLALTSVRIFGAVTPIGGLLLLAGWLTLAFKVLKS